MKKLRFIIQWSLMALLANEVYDIWQDFCPVEIVAIHKREVSSHVLVKNFPVTDRGKLDWWKKITSG